MTYTSLTEGEKKKYNWYLLVEGKTPKHKSLCCMSDKLISEFWTIEGKWDVYENGLNCRMEGRNAREDNNTSLWYKWSACKWSESGVSVSFDPRWKSILEEHENIFRNDLLGWYWISGFYRKTWIFHFFLFFSLSFSFTLLPSPSSPPQAPPPILPLPWHPPSSGSLNLCPLPCDSREIANCRALPVLQNPGCLDLTSKISGIVF